MRMSSKFTMLSQGVLIVNVLLFIVLLFWYCEKTFNGIPKHRFLNKKGENFSEVSILHSVPEPSAGQCTIFRCANRTMEHVQIFTHPGFNYIFLDDSEDVRKAKVFPSWCRVPHLMSLQEKGHSCVVYADDDVFLNLTRVRNVIDALPNDVILVGTNNRHGRYYNINSGLIIFSDIQGPLTSNILKNWRKSMDNNYYHTIENDKLRDQRALNDIMHCNMSNVFCYHLNEKKQMGLVTHCFSCMNKKNPTGKYDCMVAAKDMVKEWDRVH